MCFLEVVSGGGGVFGGKRPSGPSREGGTPFEPQALVACDKSYAAAGHEGWIKRILRTGLKEKQSQL